MSLTRKPSFDANKALNEEIKRLSKELLFSNKCLNALIEYKVFIDLIFNKFSLNLTKNNRLKYKQLREDVENVLNENYYFENIFKSAINCQQLSPNCNAIRDKSSLNTSTDGLKQQFSKSKSNAIQTRRSIQRLVSELKKTSFKCVFCGQTFSSGEPLKSHIKTHRNNNKSCDSGYSVLSQEGCDNTFKDRPQLKQQFVVSHNEKIIISTITQLKSNQLVEPSIDRSFKCTVDGCEKTFVTENGLKTHSESHSTYRNYRCAHKGCDKRFYNQTALNQHISRSHNQKNLSCDWPGCDYKTVNKRYMDRHMYCHTSERNFKCDWDGCKLSFKTQANLLNHKMVHRNDKRHACHWPGCGYRSLNPCNLREHMRIHSTECNFVCNWPECGKRFKSKRYLEEIHIRIHTNVKPFVCRFPNCEYRTYTAGNLKTHQKVHQK